MNAAPILTPVNVNAPRDYHQAAYVQVAQQIAAGNGISLPAGRDHAVTFLRSVYSRMPATAVISLFATGDNRTHWFTVDALHTSMVATTLNWAKSENETNSVYCQMASRKQRLPGKRRGDKGDLLLAPGFWCDLDCSKTDYPLLEAYSHLTNFRHKPTIITFSGGGLQAFWLFDTPADVSTADKAEQFKAAALRFFKPLFEALPSDVVDTSVLEAARVMRLPGTVNRKPDRYGAVARIIYHNGDSVVSWADVQNSPEPDRQPDRQPEPAAKITNFVNLPARPKSARCDKLPQDDGAVIRYPVRYLDSVFGRRIADVRQAVKGNRNDTLLRSATAIQIAYDELHTAMQRAGRDTGELNTCYSGGMAALFQAALSTELTETEINATIASAISDAHSTGYPLEVASETARRTIDTDTGEIANVADQQHSLTVQGREPNPGLEFSQCEDLPAPETKQYFVLPEVGTADGGDVWRGSPQWIAQYILDYAPSRQRNALLYAIDDVIAHVFQTSDPVVTAPRLYPNNDSDQRSFRRTVNDYGLDYLLQWPKESSGGAIGQFETYKAYHNSNELSDCSPLPNSGPTADDSSPAVKPFYYDQQRLPRRLMQRFVLPTLAERFHFRGMIVTTLSAWTPHTRLEARQWRQAYRDSLNTLEQAAYDDKIKALALAYLKAWRKLRDELQGPVEYWKRPAIKPTDAEIIAMSVRTGETAKFVARQLGISPPTVIRAEHRQGYIRKGLDGVSDGTWPITITDPDDLGGDDWRLHGGVLRDYVAYDKDDNPLTLEPERLSDKGDKARRQAAQMLKSGQAAYLACTVSGKTKAHKAESEADKIRLADLLEKDKKQSKGGHRETTPPDTYRAGQTVRFIGSVVLEHAQRFGVATVGKVPENIERVNNYVTTRYAAQDVTPRLTAGDTPHDVILNEAAPDGSDCTENNNPTISTTAIVESAADGDPDVHAPDVSVCFESTTCSESADVVASTPELIEINGKLVERIYHDQAYFDEWERQRRAANPEVTRMIAAAPSEFWRLKGKMRDKGWPVRERTKHDKYPARKKVSK